MTGLNFNKARRLLILGGLLIALIILTPGLFTPARAASAFSNDNEYVVMMPLIQRSWPPLPEIPVLMAIDNSDQNNAYLVNWLPAKNGITFTLEESTDPAFTAPIQVYRGPGLGWYVPNPGKFLGTYYYRIKVENRYAVSGWSNIQSVTTYPLFVGLNVRWDGVGYVRRDWYYDMGTHVTRQLDILTEPDTIRSNAFQWYAPNPLDFESDSWSTYYSVVTGQWKGSSEPGDPAWKWGHGWFLSYDYQPENGETVEIDDVDFRVSGPNYGTTTYGVTILYWEFVNKDKILYFDDGSGLKQYINPGEAVLRYDAGSSRLLIYSNLVRRFYEDGDAMNLTVQYIDNISSATSLPGSPPFDPNVGQPSENNNPLNEMYVLKLSDSIDIGE